MTEILASNKEFTSYGKLFSTYSYLLVEALWGQVRGAPRHGQLTLVLQAGTELPLPQCP